MKGRRQKAEGRRIRLAFLLTSALCLLPFLAHADKTLHWSNLAVTARLDADGRLHISEEHTIVFNGDWNGGERTFRRTLEDQLHLMQIRRVDENGNAFPLHENKSLSQIDDYAWTDNKTLRWRSRLPSDPDFVNKKITYLIEYTDGNILIPQSDGDFLLDHNFGLPDLQWPVDAYSLDLTLDRAWQPLDRVPLRIRRGPSGSGENATIRLNLRHVGASAPAAVNLGTPGPVRFALVAILFAVAILSFVQFYNREASVGRFTPLPDPSTIDRAWLDANVFKHLPEVVGAAWDDRTAAPEVAAVIARLVQEGKLSSHVEKGGMFTRDDLVLKRLKPMDAFTDYEAALVKALFISGDTTSTQQVRDHYKGRGFDPVSKISGGIEKRKRELGSTGALKVSSRTELLLLAIGIVLIVGGAFFGALNIGVDVLGLVSILILFVAGVIPAIDYRRRVTGVVVWSLEFVPQILLILAVPLDIQKFRVSPLTLTGIALLSLAAIRKILNTAMTRDSSERLENRRRLAAARAYFERELGRPNPALEDSWYPYLLAFGLGPRVDHWFRSFGTAAAGDAGGHSSSSSSSSSSSTSSGFTGGGGAFGGAGASGAWGAAAAGMAAGVAAPSSSSGGGGGGGGGGSSGGGGGGGW